MTNKTNVLSHEDMTETPANFNFDTVCLRQKKTTKQQQRKGNKTIRKGP